MEGHAPSEGGDASTSRLPPPRKRNPKRGRHQRRAAVVIDQVFRDSDLLVLVLSQLSSVTQLAHADAVSRHWHEVGRSNMVWKGFLASAFPGAEAFAGVSSFRAVYARMRGIDPSAQRPRSKLSDYQFLVNFRYTPGDTTGDDRVLASLCISEVEQPDSEDKVLYYDDLEESDGDSEGGDSEDGDLEDGDAHEGEGDDSGDDSEDVGEGDSDEVDSDEDDSDEDDEDDEDDQDDEDEEAMQEEAEALAETVKDQPPFHLRQWIDIPTLDWLWNALAELVGAQVARVHPAHPCRARPWPRDRKCLAVSRRPRARGPPGRLAPLLADSAGAPLLPPRSAPRRPRRCNCALAAAGNRTRASCSRR